MFADLTRCNTRRSRVMGTESWLITCHACIHTKCWRITCHVHHLQLWYTTYSFGKHPGFSPILTKFEAVNDFASRVTWCTYYLMHLPRCTCSSCTCLSAALGSSAVTIASTREISGYLRNYRCQYAEASPNIKCTCSLMCKCTCVTWSQH